MPQGPNYGLQGGSAWVVSDEGTLTIGAGGTLNVESGGIVNIAAGGSIVNGGEQAITGNLTIPSGGSITVASGGSIQVASGGVFRAAAATGLSAPAGMLMNGTVMKMAMGTATLTSGVGTVGVVGFTRVMAATANNILGEASGNGSATSVHVDLSLSGAGSVIFRAIAGTLGYAANQVISYQAMGT
jgi:uncharacterized protein (DUF2345 family)